MVEAKDISHGYKKNYHEENSEREGVGIILRKDRTMNVLRINRISESQQGRPKVGKQCYD